MKNLKDTVEFGVFLTKMDFDKNMDFDNAIKK
jgi:hypothetical protein